MAQTSNILSHFARLIWNNSKILWFSKAHLSSIEVMARPLVKTELYSEKNYEIISAPDVIS